MQFDDVLLGRRSVRGYKPDPVPKALIEEILTLAMRSPSSMNTQPWNFTVISGKPLDLIRAGNTERNVAGVPHSREFRIGEAFAGQHRDRQVGVAKQLFAAMGIEREDKEKRMDWVLRGFRQFDAPVCVIITYDRVLADSDDTAFDCGAVTTALVNAAWSRGLGAVINSQGIMQSPVVREHANIADDQVIMKAVALGWPDDSFPANAVVSERRSVAEATSFLGFEDKQTQKITQKVRWPVQSSRRFYCAGAKKFTLRAYASFFLPTLSLSFLPCGPAGGRAIASSQVRIILVTRVSSSLVLMPSRLA